MFEFESEKIKQIIKNQVEDILPDFELSGFLTKGSKMIRSKLCLSYLKTHNIGISENVLKIITAGELIHNASLLHDDVIDDADYRRGNLTVWKKFSPKISVICGDYLVSAAVNILSGIENFDILNSFNKCVQEMSKAEIKQFLLRNKKPNVEEYIDICEGKTAELFYTMLKSCLIVSSEEFDYTESFAKLYGVSFQLNNDFSESSAVQDKKNGIYNIVDILGIEKAKILSDNYKEEMRNLIKKMPDNGWRVELESLVNGL